jgi:hypothetical protein
VRNGDLNLGEIATGGMHLSTHHVPASEQTYRFALQVIEGLVHVPWVSVVQIIGGGINLDSGASFSFPKESELLPLLLVSILSELTYCLYTPLHFPSLFRVSFKSNQIKSNQISNDQFRFEIRKGLVMKTEIVSFKTEMFNLHTSDRMMTVDHRKAYEVE